MVMQLLKTQRIDSHSNHQKFVDFLLILILEKLKRIVEGIGSTKLLAQP